MKTPATRSSLFATLFVTVLATLLAACGGGGSSSVPVTANPPAEPTPNVPGEPVAGEGEIRVLSNRADLISGGDALVEVLAADVEQLEGASVNLGDTDITDQLTRTQAGTLKGLINGLALGNNRLTVVLADDSVLERTIINHPNGGPVISGPQIQPWQCTNAAAVDAQCNQPAEYSFKYVP